MIEYCCNFRVETVEPKLVKYNEADGTRPNRLKNALHHNELIITEF